MKTILTLALLFSTLAFAGPTVVGNGDDGSDLENFKPITKGKIVDARDEAIKVVKRLNTSGVAHLGNLLPELEHSKLYMVDKNISTERLEELGAFHSGAQKLVYARTIARPYAVTRFFPAALELDQNQLIALHIHEALHRALPESFREDEKVTSEITLAIVTPLATHDQVAAIVKKYIDNYTGKYKGHFADHESYMALEMKQASKSNETGSFSPMQQAYQLRNRIYPFDNDWSLLGLGIDLNYIHNRDHAFLSSLGLFLSIDLFTLRGFDLSLYSLWNRELGNSSSFNDYPFSRDNFTTGIAFKKKSGMLSFEHLLEYQWQRSDKRDYSGSTYNLDIGSVTKIKSQLLYNKNHYAAGAFAELNLMGSSKLNQQEPTGRSSSLAVGPKIRYQSGDLVFDFYWHQVVDSKSKGSTLSFNDQLLGPSASSHTGLVFKYIFH